MTDSLRFYLFGPFEAFRNGQLITNQDWRSQQTRAVCKVLLAQRGQVVSSSQLIEILWPEDDPQAARRRLHVRVSQLRKTLDAGKARVQTVDGGYLFSPDEDCWLDVAAFQAGLDQAAQQQELGEQRLAIQAYEQARRLYRGDFLSEDLYVDWTFSLREFYRERFLTLLTELGECYAQQGRYRLAIARLQEALGHDPVRETIYLRLMLFHYYAGERAQALRVYERCRQVLADELAVEPLDSTAGLAEQIRAGTLWASDQTPRYPPPIYEGRLFDVPYALSETPLVGRAVEYAWLVEQWQDERIRLLLVEGEAGIGKSRLVGAFAGYLRSQGWQVLSARVSTASRSPFAPLADALQPLLSLDNLVRLSPQKRAALEVLFPQVGDLVADLPALPALPPEAARQRLFQALQALVEVSLTRPRLLLIDDAQRLGEDAIDLLARLAGTLRILLSYRSEEVPVEHPLQVAFRQGQSGVTAAHLQLKPLSLAAVQQLIQQLAASELPELAAEIYDRTQGVPLFVVALLQHMFEAGQLYVEAGGAWSLTGERVLSLPPTVRETVEARLQRLDRSQRRVFDLAAVLGGEFDFALLQQASGQSEEALLAILDRLIDLALITEPRSLGRSEFAISHDRYTEVAYDTLPAVRRKQLHRQAAESIEQQTAGALPAFYPALCEHFGKAGIVDRERHYATLAGEQAARQFASQEALRYLSRALALTEGGEARGRLLLMRERVYDLQGERTRQQADLSELAAMADDLDTRQRAEIALRQAALAWIVGDNETTAARLAEALPQARAAEAPDIEAASLLLSGRSNLDQALARQELQQALALAQQQQLRALEGDITRCLGNACFWQHNYADSESYFAQALEIHREVADLQGELAVLNNLGFLHQLLGELQTSREYYRQALAICRPIGDRLAEGVLLANLGDLALQLGDFPAAQGWLEQALEIREQVANEEGVAVVLKRLGDLHRQQGQFDQALGHYQRALAISARLAHPGIQGGVLDGLGRLYCNFGDYTRAQAHFEQAGQVLQQPGSPERIRLLASQSLLYHLRGEDEAALEIGQRALAHSGEMPQIQAAALTHIAHAQAGLGRWQAAQEHFKQALEIQRSLGQLHLTVEPQAGLARLALQQGELEGALAHIEPILAELQGGPLAGPEQVSLVYLTCWQVLLACQDRRAGEILDAVDTMLQARSAGIREPELRQLYLETERTNRQIVQHFLKDQ